MVIDFSVGCVCVSHASDVLGVCVMITPALKSYRLGRFLGRFSIGWYLSSTAPSSTHRPR
jgi:hypothetical protein